MSDVEDYAHGGSPHEWRDEVKPFVVPASELVLDFDGESTSARLRRVKQELDEVLRHAEVLANGLTKTASERELLRAEVRTWDKSAFAFMRQRDAARAELASTTAELAKVKDERNEARDEVARLRRERDNGIAANHDLRDELEQQQYVGWVVARDGGRDCIACDQDIRRGEAYSVNTVSVQLTHVHCPEGAPTT